MLIFFVVFLAINVYFAIDDAKKNNAFGLVHAAVAVYCGIQAYHLLVK
jgi:hypothetical protein